MPNTDPASYGTSVVKPPDFAEFWSDIQAQVDRIPLNLTVTPVPMRSTPEVNVFEVHYDSLDHVRIAGWYCVPAGGEGPFPAVVVYPGYISEPTLPKSWAKQGYAAFGAAPRGKLRSNGQYNPGYPGLLVDNITDRHTYAYRGFYVDAWRVIDFLLQRPEVDPDRMGVTGSSQGGALTLLAAAMRSEVCAAAAGAPYLAGYMDAASLTHSYPYEEINEYLRLYPDREARVRETLNYYDVINFAERITCPIIVNIGLNDNICPPETGFAVYDAIGSGDKQLYPYAGHGHDGGSVKHGAVIADFFRQHLRPEVG